MKLIILIVVIHLFLISQLSGQSTIDFTSIIETPLRRVKTDSVRVVKSSDGYMCSPRGTYRGLAIFVNIIYDQAHPDTISKYSAPSTYWKPDTTFSINMYPPAYFTQIFDTHYKDEYKGLLSRFYSESSFHQLHLLCDMMVVNIRQSQITPKNPAADFSLFNLMDAVAELINQNGGVKTIHGFNNISDFDRSSFASLAEDRPDGKIDMIHFVLRNTFIRNKIINYGSANPGSGYSGWGIFPRIPLKIGNSYHQYNIGSYQCVGGGSIAASSRSIWSHEIAHYFLGGNEFHTSGGNHTGDYIFMPVPFLGIQRGYGLFDGGLSSCNGYERLRLGWQSSSNNSYAIAANNQHSDVEKFEGERTFTLRDFVTTGDVIRIKMPYKDNPESSNQYIWLENHQCGKNGKLDDFVFSTPNGCRDVAQAGIYAYYQVGKDVLESMHDSIVFPKNEKDNLRIISAEGNYDVIYHGRVDDCLRFCGGNCRPQYEYVSENPFSGVNDHTEVYPSNFLSTQLKYNASMQYFGSKIKNGVLYNNLPWLGDRFDPFIPTSEGVRFDISTNPAAVNTTTFYNIQNTRVGDSLTFKAVDSIRNTRRIYLSGLSIRMIDSDPAQNGMKAYIVKIRWDDYDVKQDVVWKGDLVLKEKLNLLQDKKISLQQSRSVNQISFDKVSGCFARTTFLTCQPGSELNMSERSTIELKEKSTMILENNANLEIHNDSRLIVESGSTLIVRSGANIKIHNSGKITVKSGGFICIEKGTNIISENAYTNIYTEEGSIIGANPDLFAETGCTLLK